MKNLRVRRGEVFLVRMDNDNGLHEQSGVSVAIVVQNKNGNIYSGTTIVVFCSSRVKKEELPTHLVFELNGKQYMLLGEIIRTISKTRIYEKIGTVNPEYMEKIDKVLLISLGLER